VQKRALAEKVQQLINIYKIDGENLPDIGKKCETNDRIQEIIELIEEGPQAIDNCLKRLRGYFLGGDLSKPPSFSKMGIAGLENKSSEQQTPKRMAESRQKKMDALRNYYGGLVEKNAGADYVRFFCDQMEGLLKNYSGGNSQRTLDVLNLKWAWLDSEEKDKIPAKILRGMREIKNSVKFLMAYDETPVEAKVSSIRNSSR
jgi:hypothetical protein